MIDFDAVFFIRLQKTTKVTWATKKKIEKNEKKGAFLAKNVFLCGRHRNKQKLEGTKQVYKTYFLLCGRQRNYQKHLLALLAMCSFTQKKKNNVRSYYHN